MRAAVVAVACLAAGCGRYADFALPPPTGVYQPVSFRWQVREEPVMARGSMTDVLNPSVFPWRGALANLYSEFDGKTWHTALATSADGFAWVPAGRVLSPDPTRWEGSYLAANGSGLVHQGEILYWYQAGSPPRIGLARSVDGRSWTKTPEAVLDLGPRGSWDERGLGDPYVIRQGDFFFLFYTGIDRARRQRLGVARSRDGVIWDKLRSNPVLELGDFRAFDEAGLGEPAVWTSHGHYWMLYTGRDRAENRRIGLAESRDGVRWQRSGAAPSLAGAQAWNSKVVCDPTVIQEPDGRVRVWFGGGDVARPDERLNGQVGYAELLPR